MLDKILAILEEEIVPAEGCTEPIALAYAGSKLRDILGNIPEKIEISLSGNMIKNVKSVKIPSSEGMVGIEAAVAMGLILGDSTKELMVISGVDRTKLPEVRKYLSENRMNVVLNKGDVKLYIKLTGTCGNDVATVEIQHYHTNITEITKNGEKVIGCSCDDKCGGESPMTDRSFLTLELIYNTAKTIDLSLIEPIFKKVIDCNTAIAKEGLTTEYGIAIGKTIKEGIEEGIYGNDLKNNMASFASAGSDARMNGCSLPVMTTSGSGNQGMTASLPVIKFCEMKNIPYEQLIRGLFFSHMTTIHIKTNIGRLSAYCGAMCASAGVAGAISFLDGLTLEQCAMAVETTLGTMSGLICDGAKSSCATKIASGISCAFDSYYTAKKNRRLLFGEGIIGRDVEATIKNTGILGKDGMQVTDEVILNIMVNNK
ncbi:MULTISPECIES: serine dehydratase subunit alpha family protein [Fusobacterium]|uniref:L-cysteine desulfidase family protein n=1 Tax=Fusobacterium TaxID=848 RepID=UPI00147774C6|nr:MULTISPECIES: L-serine ammonia-lyase, iron-sulfur-dependent, subunit alpha [Fusobacterium]NME36053.1 serine dehydratase subunit alpha family protein [Fusobacterium sp. FSA-380-WT-3A]